MQRFYNCSEKELLEIPIFRFWNKEKNMRILKLQEKLDAISEILMPYSSNVQRTIARLEWQLNKLKQHERVDSISDIKKKQKPIKSKELDDIKRRIMDQRRKARKEKYRSLS